MALLSALALRFLLLPELLPLPTAAARTGPEPAVAASAWPSLWVSRKHAVSARWGMALVRLGIPSMVPFSPPEPSTVAVCSTAQLLWQLSSWWAWQPLVWPSADVDPASGFPCGGETGPGEEDLAHGDATCSSPSCCGGGPSGCAASGIALRNPFPGSDPFPCAPAAKSATALLSAGGGTTGGCAPERLQRLSCSHSLLGEALPPWAFSSGTSSVAGSGLRFPSPEELLGV